MEIKISTRIFPSRTFIPNEDDCANYNGVTLSLDYLMSDFEYSGIEPDLEDPMMPGKETWTCGKAFFHVEKFSSVCLINADDEDLWRVEIDFDGTSRYIALTFPSHTLAEDAMQKILDWHNKYLTANR